MIYTLLTRWATEYPWPALTTAILALALIGTAVYLTARSVPSIPVAIAALGALVCTGYTGDTSWRFAEHHLGMRDLTERGVMFAAGEVALLACAVMARANKKATATETLAGSAGTPGVLVWVITGVQVIPAYSESGIVGGTVRAIFGPVMAGLLWHLAMGLEIRVARPEALSTGLPAMIGRELRERLLSYLGLATRDRTAEQITRDRATARAVRLASRKNLRGWGRHRLAAAVARSGAALDPDRNKRMMHQLAARRSAGQLATVDIASPWQMPAEYQTTIERVPVPDPAVEAPEVYPALPAPVPAVPNEVPAGACLLPVVCRQSLRAPTAVLPAKAAPTRDMVHSKYVPGYPVPAVPEYPVPGGRYPTPGHAEVHDEEVPEGDLDVPDPDPLLTQARTDFPTEVPGIARLKKKYGIGQARAQRIRDALGSPV